MLLLYMMKFTGFPKKCTFCTDATLLHESVTVTMALLHAQSMKFFGTPEEFSHRWVDGFMLRTCCSSLHPLRLHWIEFFGNPNIFTTIRIVLSVSNTRSGSVGVVDEILREQRRIFAGHR